MRKIFNIFFVQLTILTIKLVSTIVMFISMPIWLYPFALIAPSYSIIAAIGSSGTTIEILYLTVFFVSLALFVVVFITGLLCIAIKKLRRVMNILFNIYATTELIVA